LIFLGFFLTRVTLPAWIILLYWGLLQLVGSIPAVAGGATGGGVAFVAHLGGFVAGAALIKLFARAEFVARHRRRVVGKVG
jgi:membrane associated rhomboid family serine protease